MGTLLAELLPFAIGLAITPAAIATCILFLGSRRPVRDALAFSAAFALVYAIIAAVILVAASTTSGGLIDDRTKALVTLVVGIALLGLAALGVIRGHAGPPTRTPGWMRAIDTAGARVAFGLGLALAVLNPNVPILIAGLATIAAANVSGAGQAVSAVFLIAASEFGMLGPTVWYVTHEESAKRGLAAVKAWLATHEHWVNLAVLVVFGALFTYKGISGL